jgi:hypothetical protein
MDIDQYKQKLQQEIDVAEANLIHNISNLDIKKYVFGSGSAVITSIPLHLLKDPLDSIDTVSTFSRQLFKPNHFINRLLSKVNFVSTIIKKIIK